LLKSHEAVTSCQMLKVQLRNLFGDFKNACKIVEPLFTRLSCFVFYLKLVSSGDCTVPNRMVCWVLGLYKAASYAAANCFCWM